MCIQAAGEGRTGRTVALPAIPRSCGMHGLGVEIPFRSSVADRAASAASESLNVQPVESGVDVGIFEVRIEGNAHVMVSGELDMRTAPQLVSAVESLAGTEVERVVVDLSRVTFMDSSGVSALCLAKAKLDVDGTILVLREVSTPVSSVLRMCGLESEFVREAGS